MFISFNSTFTPLFALGFLGQPRRVVTYATHLQALNDWVSVSAFVLGISMLVFLANVVWSLMCSRDPAEAEPVALEVARVAAADAGPGLRLRAHPGDHPTRTLRLRPPSCPRRRRRAGDAERRRRWKPQHPRSRSSPSRPTRSRGTCGSRRASAPAPPRSSSSRSSSPTSTCARSTPRPTGRSARPPVDRLGRRDRARDPVSARAARRGRRAAGAPPASVARSPSGSLRVVLQVRRVHDARLRAASGGYASVFFGWTAMYAVLGSMRYWLEMQVATIGAARGSGRAARRGDPTSGADRHSRRARSTGRSSPAIGVLAFVVLYLV